MTLGGNLDLTRLLSKAAGGARQWAGHGSLSLGQGFLEERASDNSSGSPPQYGSRTTRCPQAVSGAASGHSTT